MHRPEGGRGFTRGREIKARNLGASLDYRIRRLPKAAGLSKAYLIRARPQSDLVGYANLEEYHNLEERQA